MVAIKRLDGDAREYVSPYSGNVIRFKESELPVLAPGCDLGRIRDDNTVQATRNIPRFGTSNRFV